MKYKHIWVNGTINSGKSTVSKILGKELKMAVIEIDRFTDCVRDWMPLPEAFALNVALIPDIVAMYEKHGVGVIIPYPLSSKNYEELQEILKDFLVVTVDPSIEIALTDRGDRKLGDWERERIKTHYEMGIPFLPYGIRIETHEINADETAREITRHINI